MAKHSMTLAEWQVEAPHVHVADHKSGTKVIAQAQILRPGPYVLAISKLEVQLWRLSDWTVSSVTGGSIWLTPKEGNNVLD